MGYIGEQGNDEGGAPGPSGRLLQENAATFLPVLPRDGLSGAPLHQLCNRHPCARRFLLELPAGQVE
eukprot:3661695-Pyramimonas_sp.AAC.1